MPLNPDDTLLNGQFCIIRQLGRGGFGFVYLAQDTLLGEQVAIKELIPALVGDATMLRRFLAEAKATMRLSHDRIVRTHNVFSEGGNYYIVMEYMPGGSLEERLQEQGALPIDEAVRIAAEVCEGLSSAHQRGIVHCDLKPANILFAADGAAKVADFGIAHVSGEMLSRSWMTPTGFVAGTLPYMSPEQADGVRNEPRVDVYALGAVLYRMLTGRTYLEFDHQETPRAQMENLQRIYNQQPVPPSAHSPHTPSWLDAVILKALAKRPEERYAAVERLRAVLLQQQVPQEVAPPAPAETRLASARPTPPPPAVSALSVPAWWASQPTLFWLLAGAAAILLIGLVIAISVALGGGEGRIAVAPTLTPSETAPVPTSTPATVSTPATTAMGTSLPTDKPASPTAMDAPLPTNTRIAPTATDTALPTNTEVPPTATPTPQPTSTPVPPTATRTPQPTRTPVPPTATLRSNTATPTPKGPAAGEATTRARDGMKMVYVPAGEFTMGSKDGEDDEKPMHTVYLDAFWIDRTEVSNAQFRKCVEAGSCTAPTVPASWTRGDYHVNPSFDDYPVIFVDWEQAKTYCAWVGARLPTEAEWEKAARGTDGRTYPWGGGIDCSRANYSGQDTKCVGDTTMAGSYPSGASPYGALDMAGNVLEWTSSLHRDYPYQADDGREDMQASGRRVQRGGSWHYDFRGGMRTSERFECDPSYADYSIGFRCARSGPEP